MGLNFEGRVFEDNFLIVDIRFAGKQAAMRPSERWFWFDPPFCPGGTALLHKQPDDIWRLDFQLGRHINRDTVLRPDYFDPLIKGMLGAETAYEKEWVSVYTFQCRRMDRFVHGPVVFLGDSAHLVSPFGARGANGGLADADNLAWKLDRVLQGKAGQSLIESYNHERVQAADENILHSTRATDFITPKNRASLACRNAILELASKYDFAQPFINSGRLSAPTPYQDSPLSTPDEDAWYAGPAPGTPALDAPLKQTGQAQWLLEALGEDFKLLHFGPALKGLDLEQISLKTDSAAAKLYDGAAGATYLIRPDQIIAARWKQPTLEKINTALKRALAK